MTRGPRRRRERLDQILVERGLSDSRSRAQALILAGRVRSGETTLTKPGVRYAEDIELTVAAGRRFVSRGAYKLQAAIQHFDLRARGRDCIDVGASTGGFTQVLLEAGAERVIALDVGRGQLDWSLRNDPRVTPIEGVNARYLERTALPFTPSLATVDVAFISLTLVLAPVVGCLEPIQRADVVALVKPQFEVGRNRVGRGGIVRDTGDHRRVVEKIAGFCRDRGWGILGLLASPLAGADGNREFLVHIRPAHDALPPEELDRQTEAALISSIEREVAG
jgi:23S rRNA (cytidine1920-2'-O)/16S rRNA (cytidine1409-2'-O)-methyltransferase